MMTVTPAHAGVTELPILGSFIGRARTVRPDRGKEINVCLHRTRRSPLGNPP